MTIELTDSLTAYRTLINKNEADIAGLQTASFNYDTQLSGLIVNEQEVFRAVSYVTQEPSALDIPIQITYGAAQANEYFSLDASGQFTVLTAGNYSLILRLVFGRTGSPGVANLFARGLINGIQNVGSIHALLDDSSQSSSSLFFLSATLPASTVFSSQLMRSSANGGVNAGGLFAQPAPLAGWQPSASCSIVIMRRQVILGS